MARVNPSDKIAKVELKNKTQEKIAEALSSGGDDDTRQKLAKSFIRYYFWILILIIIGVPGYNYVMYQVSRPEIIVSIRDAILTYSAIAGPTFGLVMAYYFKEKNSS